MNDYKKIEDLERISLKAGLPLEGSFDEHIEPMLKSNDNMKSFNGPSWDYHINTARIVRELFSGGNYNITEITEPIPEGKPHPIFTNLPRSYNMKIDLNSADNEIKSRLEAKKYVDTGIIGIDYISLPGYGDEGIFISNDSLLHGGLEIMPDSSLNDPTDVLITYIKKQLDI